QRVLYQVFGVPHVAGQAAAEAVEFRPQRLDLVQELAARFTYDDGEVFADGLGHGSLPVSMLVMGKSASRIRTIPLQPDSLACMASTAVTHSRKRNTKKTAAMRLWKVLGLPALTLPPL